MNGGSFCLCCSECLKTVTTAGILLTSHRVVLRVSKLGGNSGCILCIINYVNIFVTLLCYFCYFRVHFM